MVKIVAGLGENTNIQKAASNIEDFEVEFVKSNKDLLEAINNPDVDAVVRGSLSASDVIKSLKNSNNNASINRGTYIRSDDYDFLILPVGIDEGQTVEDKKILIKQASEFILKLGKVPKIAILSSGRADDYNRNPNVDSALKDSETLEKLVKDDLSNDKKFKDIDYSVKNYYILIEQAINDKNNIIVAPDGIIGNYIFRILVLLCKWPSYGAVTLGIDEIYIDTSRDQSVEGYSRSLFLAYELAKMKQGLK